jgi:metallo-beta-lactamase class B
MKIFQILFLLCCGVFSLCAFAQNAANSTSSVVYRSPLLEVEQITPHTFVHRSFLQTDDFGKVSCNGLLIQVGEEVMIFDSPTANESSQELIHWVQQELESKLVAIVPTHFHSDCLGGLQAFHEAGIPSHALDLTLELASASKATVPQHGFTQATQFLIGGKEVWVSFFGEGHTRDNVVGYFSQDHVLFGGCLIKEMNANKGYLGDANVEAWYKTVQQVKDAFPLVNWVVPGHGKVGDASLLDYTIRIFSVQ